MKIAVIGAGLAGTALGYVSDTIASGASGNDLGLINPRISAHRTPQSDFYTSAFAHAVRTFSAMDDVDWNECGSLHLITDEKREKRYVQTVENWGWPEKNLRFMLWRLSFCAD